MELIVKKAVFIGLLCFLSGCATMSPRNTSPDNLTSLLSAEDKQEFNMKMNTAQDGVTTVWRNKADTIGFKLTTRDTHVNAQGLPCRSYTLVINPDYHRKKTMSTVACRDNGDWMSSEMIDDEGN